MDLRTARKWLAPTVMLAVMFGLAASGQAIQWISVGPDGGDARAFAAEPGNARHLYLGTTSSWIYESKDGGSSWQRLAKLGKSDDLIVDNIFVDASDTKTLVAGVWKVDERGGGIYISHNAGVSWTPVADMDGQSVRALAQAPSNPKLYVAGTVSGVYRSQDGGTHWAQMSPAGSTEIHEVESVAIDPVDTNTIYAGTWHLPWKTTDGGAHWTNVKEGLIDDSDVFSIIIDPSAPSIVYASACSGIYKSENAGALFHKVQGIPSTARRTRVLMQDPNAHDVVYAGTTEGLYKTADAGKDWTRLTGADVIINDVYVDPKDSQHLLLATDRSGVLDSQDGGKNFQASNTGFSQRQVETLLLDRKSPGTLYAGVLNDKIYGGMFVSHDEGRKWEQQSAGLEGRDVFALAQSGDGTLLAGTERGVYSFNGVQWQRIGQIVNHGHKTVMTHVKKRAVKKEIDTVTKGGQIDTRVNQLDVSGNNWYAATAEGVYSSADKGVTWEGPLLPSAYQFVDAYDTTVIAAGRDLLQVSEDAGKSWQQVALPSKLLAVHALAVASDHTLWVGGREGLFYSADAGKRWKELPNLPLGDITGLNWDEELKRVLVTSRAATMVFGVDDSGTPWKWWETGWNVHEVHSRGGRLVGASLYDGVVIEPSSAATATASNGGAQ
jgi:photosystem II stability/assembly factor-like uncharacterized protein